MADDLSLLFRLRADNAQAKAVLNDTRAAVAQLRQSFGPQLTQTVTVANKAFSDIGDNLQSFVAQRVPLVGGAIVRITDGLKQFGGESAKTQKAITGVANSIQSLATQSGKTVPAITSFLTKFVQLEGQAKRDKAAVDFFGASLGTKLIPELEKTGTALTALSAESAAAGSSIASMAGPIGIAVAAIIALHVAAAIAAKEIFELAKRSAEFQGKMFDLAQQTGLAVETLSALEVVAKTTGGSIDTITQAVVLFQRKLDEAQDPLSKTAELFRKFNIDTADTETSLRSAFTALARMPEGFAQTNAAAELFGARGGKQVLAILKETQGDLDLTTQKLREMGILISEESARAADKFNDELALLQFQLRDLGAAAAEDLIPLLTEAIRGFGDLVQAIRPLASVVSSVASVALKPFARVLNDVSLIVLALTGQFKELSKAIKEAEDAKNIGAIKIPALAPIPLPGAPTDRQAASDAANQADAVVAIVKRSVAAQNQALDELFQKGRRNRQQQAEETIASNKQVLEAEKQKIDSLLDLREQEIKALDEAQTKRGEVVRRDTEDYRAITKEVGKLQQERLDKENEFEVSSRAIRAKAAKERADSTRNQIRNESDLLSNEFDRQIKEIEARIARGAIAEEDGLTIIEQLEQAKIDARIESLERQRQVGLLTVQDQIDLNNELKKLEQERDRLGDEQRNRRLDRDRAAAERTRDILIANLDTFLQLEQIAGEQRIATLQALADLRVLTEEGAAKKILKIRLDLLDDEIEATKAKLKAASSIADRDERIRTEADLNNQLKILGAQRKATQDAGNRDIDLGRQKDIDNAKRYAEELKDLEERTRRIQRDAAEEAIRLMIATFARRRDIIRARRDLELQEEDDRHRRETESLKQQTREVDEQIKVLEKYLERFKATTEEEIKERDKIIESLEKLRLKRLELEGQQEAEDERNKTRKRRVTVEADIELADPDVALQDVFDGIAESITNLAGKFAELIGLGEEFSAISAQIAEQIGNTLAGAFNQFANALAQTVANWVLLGETGPAVMRKILAQALASIAAEAAVNAIKELALGFATLFFNPAESAAHFTAAGLWASIGVGSALAGRAVAGDLFKQRSAGAGGSAGGVGSSGELNPLNLARNAGPGSQQQIADQIRPIQVQITVNDSKFGKAITAHIVDDINNAGAIREVIAGDGNLNRG